MAVTYMLKLEQQPESYDSKFKSLTQGINLEVHNWILDKTAPDQSILEVGCGTGSLASKMALKGCKVIAIDKNYQMISYAMKNIPEKDNIELIYQIGTIKSLNVPDKSQDLVISTFMLSELRPLEQQIFLRNSWKALKTGGRLIIAAEFVPSGIWKIPFKVKRWFYGKKLKRLNIDKSKPLEHFYDYLEPIGFKIVDNEEWIHGSIRVIELVKNSRPNSKPGYYSPEKPKIKGFSSQLKIWRCLLTGQVDNISVEPGLYKSGDPDAKSPIIATANYVYTFIKVMRDLEDIDAWVLSLDSNGINVWCAARGNDFGNTQLVEAVEATVLRQFTENRTIILPQLSAGGVSKPNLPEMSEKFPFKVKYGPVWSKYLKEYLTKRPNKKPQKMKRARFTLQHRISAGITHTTFLMRKVFFFPLLTLFISFLALDIINVINKTWMVGDLLIWILFPNLILTLLYPLSQFTRNFIVKSLFFGIINTIFLGIITWFLRLSLLYIFLNLFFFLWIGFFTTMSFSGYTMSTNPREIRDEYPLFKKLNSLLLSVGVISTILSVIII
ncbi:MAG: methyltransferase domain-containing protein [Promethearchaeati archaeon]